jgi:hypothetical protein
MAAVAVPLGIVLAAVATAGVASRWRVAVLIALAVAAGLAAFAPATWWTGALAAGATVACAAGPRVDLSPVRIAAVSALLTAFVVIVHWPGRAAIAGGPVLAAVVGVPIAATVAAAAELHALGNVWFVIGLVAGVAAVLVTLAPMFRWAADD